MVTFTVHRSWQHSLLHVLAVCSSTCVFLPPALPFFPDVSLGWLAAGPFHFLWAISSETVLQLWRRGISLKSLGTGFMCSCIWWKSGTFVLLLLFTWNPSREYLFITLTLYWKQRSFAASSTGTWLAVTAVRFWEMVVFQQFPVSSMLLDISWVTVFLSLLKMSKSLVQNCGTEYLVSFSFRSPETGTWSSNLPTSKASEYW